MVFNISCNVCLRKASLSNISNNKYGDLYNLVQLLAGPQKAAKDIDLLICAKCHMILRKICDFQQQLRKAQSHIAHFLFQRSKAKNVPKTVTESTSVVFAEPFREGSNTHSNGAAVSKLDEHDCETRVKKEENEADKSSHDLSEMCDDNDYKDDSTTYHDLDCEDSSAVTSMDQEKVKSIEDDKILPSDELTTSRRDVTTRSLFSKEVVMPIIDDIKAKFINNRKCCLCNFSSDTRRLLISHMLIKHEEKSNAWCKMCNTLLEKKEPHKCQGNMFCKFCKFPCKDPLRLVEHLYMHCANQGSNKDRMRNAAIVQPKSSTTKKFKCRRCSKVYTDEVRMRAHKCPIVSKTCTYCGKYFTNPERYNSHLRLHTGEPRYKCRYCDKPMAQRYMLIDHERIHTGEKPHVCKFCGKAFTQASHLRTHSKLHTGPPEKCLLCDKSFCRAVDLRNHVKRSHLGQKAEKTLLCNTCGYVTNNNWSLKQHMETHSDVRNYVCQTCGKAFKQKAILQKHSKIHSGTKPHKCPICPYRCTQKSNLKQHAKKHANEAARRAAESGIANCRCVHCNKPFTNEQLLLEHIRSTHAQLD